VNRGYLKDNYLIVNVVFAGIIVAIIGYSYIFGSKGWDYPVPSGPEILSGEDSASTGLSRSFSAIVRFNFDEANRHNPYGLQIFLFFFIQLILRISAIMVISKGMKIHRQTMVMFDVTLSVLMFVLLFQPFIRILIKEISS
jgi:hypothetical protein